MKALHKIVKNISFLFIAQIIGNLLNFFFLMYTARYLGAEDFGTISFAVAFTAIFSIFSDLGLTTLTVREISRDQTLTDKWIGNIIIIKILLALLFFGLIVITITLIGYQEKTIFVIYIIAFSVIIGAFINIFYSIFQASEKMEYISIGQVITSIAMLSGALIAIAYNYDIIAFASIFLFANIFVLIYCIVICSWKFIVPKLSVDPSFWKPLIIDAIPFGLTGIFGMIYTYIDSIMLSFMKGDEIVGWYSVSYKLVLCLSFIPVIINRAVFPTMSRCYPSSRDGLSLIVQKYLKLMITIAIPLGFGTIFIAKEIILLIFGQEYYPSIIILQILIWALSISFIGAALIQLFISINKQIIIIKISAFCVLINIIMNLLLIPTFSYIGASVATVITEFILISSIFVYANKLGYVSFKDFLKIVLQVIFASLIMYLFLNIFTNFNILILVPIAGIFYFICLYLLGGINKEDIYLIRS